VTRGFGDFFEETVAAHGFIAGEGGAVGDVVEEQAFSHQFSALSLEQEGGGGPGSGFLNSSTQGAQRFTE